MIYTLYKYRSQLLSPRHTIATVGLIIFQVLNCPDCCNATYTGSTRNLGKCGEGSRESVECAMKDLTSLHIYPTGIGHPCTVNK